MLKSIIKSLEKVLSYTTWGINRYQKPYEPVVKKELSMVSLNHHHKVLNIGCGAIPFTAIIIAQHTQAQVVAVDTDIKAIKRAKKVVKKLELEAFITCVHVGKKTVIQKRFDVVFLALQTKPLTWVIDAYHHAEHPPLFIARVPKKAYAKHYDLLPGDINVIDRVDYTMKAFDQSVLFKREASL